MVEAPDSPITIIIIGILCILPYLAEIRFGKDGLPGIVVPKKGKEKILVIFGIFLIFIGIFLQVFIPGSIPNPIPPQDPEVKITYPSNEASVNIRETITGTATNIPEGKHLWIAIYPQNGSKYYPQIPVNIQNDGSWKLPVQFGGEEHVGQKFDIIVMLADQSAQKELNNYVIGSEEKKFWEGMLVLPDGVTEIVRFTVTRV